MPAVAPQMYFSSWVVAGGQLALVLLIVRQVHQEGERRLEDVGHLVRIGQQREARPHEADHRHDQVAGAGLIGRGQAHRLHEAGLEPDLLVRLPQRRLPGRFARILPAARQRDLARVAAQGVGAAGEEHVQPVVALDQADQDRGRRQLIDRHVGPAAGRQVEVRAALAAFDGAVVQRVQVLGDPVADLAGGSHGVHSWCAPAGPTGNQAPLEVTPRVSPSGVSRGSAISTSS
jgi:hypothetical protein